MTRLVLEQVTDFGDFTRGTDLGEFLKQTNSNGCWNNSLSNVRVSPDGRHIHVILRKPKVGLMTYDKYQRPQMTQSPKHLDLGPTRTSPIVDILYLDHVKNRDGGVALVAVVFENGTAEFWRFLECQAGWSLLHTSDLCNSPRAKVVSVSAGSGCVVWCEERPPSESSSSAPSAARNSFRYCICKRSYEVDDGGAVSLGGVKIALHNNPCYTVVSSGENVYLLPNATERCGGASSQGFDKFFLSWSPQHDTFRVSSACTGTLLRRDGPLGKESDFRRLVTDCVGYLSSLSPPEIRAFAPTGCGGLLLLLATGWVSLLQRDGVVRRVYGGLSEHGAAVSPGGGPLSLRLYGDTLALAAGRTLYLADARCGRELERIPLRSGSALLYADRADGGAPRLLSEAGLFAVAPRAAAAAPEEGLMGAGGRLAEAVFEEACQYYQQRSLGSTRLTAEKLRRGGMFQAPVSLAAILRDHLSGVGGAGGAGGGGPDRLRGSLEAELKALVALEELKGRAVRGGEEEARALLEGLVQQEVGRLLSASAEPEREALLYLNSVFSRFPRQAWAAAQASLGMRCGGDDGSLCVRASPEVWKAVLAPVPGPGPAPTPHRANGQPGGHTPAVKPGVPHPASPSGPKPGPPDPAPLPVFELLCRSVLRYQPGWLPRFLEAAQQQQQQGSAGLGGLGGLGLGGSWSYSDAGRGGGETAGGGESLPLYKRALSVLAASRPDRDRDQDQDRDLEVELLLVSGRPNAVLQALRVLMGARQWERVTRVAQRFCRSSPLLGAELFSALLGEVAQHRDLDPYLDLLWTLCPEELTVTSILNMVLKNLPSSSSSSSSAPPFSEPGRGPLTVGLLKPLLSKVLQRETRPSQRYADILPSPGLPPPATPSLPPATPPRHARGLPPPPPDQQNQQNQPLPPLDQQHDPPPTHWTLPGGRLTSPPNPV